jgi:hypothetical protein
LQFRLKANLLEISMKKLLIAATAVLVSVGIAESAEAAGWVNEKMSDLTHEDLIAACSKVLPAGTGDWQNQIKYYRGQNEVTCIRQVQVIANSLVNVKNQASLTARKTGLKGELKVSMSGRFTYTATITSVSKVKSLKDYCREKHTSNYTYWAHHVIWGRIFVGDGGYACYKEVWKW